MLAWARRKAAALGVPTLMFAVMAAVMAEFFMGAKPFTAAWGDGLASRGMLWTWRIGGLLTWPTFMYLMLRPHLRPKDGAVRQVLLRTLAVSAVYGGGGLWAISGAWEAFARLDEHAMMLVSPFVALASLGLPYLYTWGFVAIYGLARDALAARARHGWMARSLGATVLGIYAIGALIYVALAVVALPVAMVLGMLPDEAGAHLAADLFAIALSTGNFMSQWYAFYRVDAWLDEGVAGAPTSAPTVPLGAEALRGASPAGPVTSQETVVLPDGRLVTPDGRVFVPQDPAGAASAPAAAPPGPDPARPAPAHPASRASQEAGPDPYGYGSKSW